MNDLRPIDQVFKTKAITSQVKWESSSLVHVKQHKLKTEFTLGIHENP